MTGAERDALQSYPERARIWEPFMLNMEARDRQSTISSLQMPKPNSILFIGSSSIRKWDLDASFSGLPVYNRGFGGSQIQDSTYYADRILIPYKPRIVVFYAGDNDVGAGHTREQVIGDFQTFARKFRTHLPDAKLIFLPIKPSVSKAKKLDQIAEINGSIASWLASQSNMEYLDLYTPLLSEKGELRPELYADGLHLSPAGYEIWTRLLRPHLG